jgi:transcriptional regulator with XRE-family HTH domain
MSRSSAENLSEFTTRIMFEKGLNFQEVSEMSGGAITESYVRSITSGAASNPSVRKLKALAQGLGISEDEVFRVARGESESDQGSIEDNTAASYHVILKLMNECWKNSVLNELLHEVAKLSPDSQQQAIKLLRVLNKRQLASARIRKMR